MKRLAIVMSLLIALGTGAPGRADAQIYVFTNDCDGSVLAARLAAIFSGEILGRRQVNDILFRPVSSAPNRVLEAGEAYRMTYEVHPLCSKESLGGDFCSAVQPYDMSLRHMVGNRFPEALRSGTEQRKTRVGEQLCSVPRNITFQFRAPILEKDRANPGPITVTAGLCPPNAKLDCEVHRVRVAPRDPNAGWEVARLWQVTQRIRAKQAFTLSTSVVNNTRGGSWPGSEVTVWLYPALSNTPSRVARVALPTIQRGQAHGLHITLPANRSGRHLYQACFSGTPNASHADSLCGPRTRIEIKP